MNIKTKKNVLTVYIAIAAIAAVLFSAYRVVLLKQYYDPYDMSFELGSGNIFRMFEYVLLAIAALMYTCTFLFKNTRFQLFSKRTSTTSISICAICGAIMLAVAILVVVYHRGEFLNFYNNSFLHRVLFIVALGLLFISSVYFFICASTQFANSDYKAYCSIVLPLFAVFYLGSIYFNADLIFYDSNRITSTIAFISVVFFLLSEAKVALGQGGHAFHFAASLACIVCVSAHILPTVFLISFWEMSLTMYRVIEFSTLGILLYASFSAVNSIRTMEEFIAPKTEDQANETQS